MKTHFFFDLDGTLCDTGEGVLNSVVYSLSRFGIDVKDKSSLGGFMGPPLDVSFKKYYGFDDEKAAKAVEYYREYYRPKGIYEFTPYEGMEELLRALRQAGKKLFVATSKPETFAKQVLEKCAFDVYFDGIYGSTFDGSRSTKTEVLRYAVASSGIGDTADGVMIGDREYDILGAAAVGLESVGVLFGYGSREEFEKSGAAHVVATPMEIYEIFCA